MKRRMTLIRHEKYPWYLNKGWMTQPRTFHEVKKPKVCEKEPVENPVTPQTKDFVFKFEVDETYVLLIVLIILLLN